MFHNLSGGRGLSSSQSIPPHLLIVGGGILRILRILLILKILRILLAF